MCLGDFLVNFVIWLHHSCLPSIPPAAHTCIAPSAYIAHCGFSRSIGIGFMARRGRGRRGGWRHPRINFLSLAVSIFVALVMVLFGSKINNGLKQQINAHDNK
jgi:hypothetical protein